MAWHPALESDAVAQVRARRKSRRKLRWAVVDRAAASKAGSVSAEESESSQPSAQASSRGREPRQPPSPQPPADAARHDEDSTPANEGLPKASLLLLEVLNYFYKERLEPLDHHVVRELEVRSGRRSSLRELRQVAAGTPRVQVVEDTADNRSWIYLDGVSKDFADQKSLDDPYPEDLWDDLQELADWLSADGADGLGRSRFDCARNLRTALPALNSYPLGELCHIVQLAVCKHHIFGYRKGMIVPHTMSVEHEKRGQAEIMQAWNQHSLPVLDWHAFRSMLQEFLEGLTDPPGLALSAMKALFRVKFNVELSETALGHTKLSALFKDPRLADICRLESRGAELFVCRVGDPALGSPVTWDMEELRNARGAGIVVVRGGGREAGARRSLARVEERGSTRVVLDGEVGWRDVQQGQVRNTFLQFAESVPDQQRPRARSEPWWRRP